MKSLFLLLQIGELFQGHFNWRGAFQLFLFILMGLIIIGFGVFTGYKAFAKPKKKGQYSK
jgi:hypothetical protein